MPLDHERLIVYQRSLAFVTWSSDLLKALGPCGEVRSQLDRASTSVPLNIAEGNGKFSPRDRVRFLDIAQGSALECGACLDVLAAKKLVAEPELVVGKSILVEVVNRLNRLRESVLARETASRSNYALREGGETWMSLSEVEQE